MQESLINDVDEIKGDENTAVNPVSLSDFIVALTESMFPGVRDCSMDVILVIIWYDVLNKLDVYNIVVVLQYEPNDMGVNDRLTVSTQ